VDGAQSRRSRASQEKDPGLRGLTVTRMRRKRNRAGFNVMRGVAGLNCRWRPQSLQELRRADARRNVTAG
jgi:hypothetical protein